MARRAVLTERDAAWLWPNPAYPELVGALAGDIALFKNVAI